MFSCHFVMLAIFYGIHPHKLGSLLQGAQQLTIGHQGTKELFTGQKLFHNQISTGWPVFIAMAFHLYSP